MKTKTLFISLSIYVVFILVAYLALAQEDVARKLLMGALLLGGMAGGFFDGKQGIKGVGVSTVMIIALHLLSNIVFTTDPFFVLAIFMLLFFQFILLCGWAFGYKALR